MGERTTKERRLEGPTQLVYQEDQPVIVVQAVRVVVVAGPDRGGERILDIRRVRVGQAPDNDMVLSDPLISRYHLELQVHDRGFLVSDQNSTNGTFFRGARIREALLGPGAEILIGSTTLRLEPAGERSEVIRGTPGLGRIVAVSPAMQRICGLIRTVASTDTTVLIEGETGTGKEAVAEELHRHSPRNQGPLVVLDCGALPGNLFESELFGHEKGAFTGAEEIRRGVFEKARGGTVFIDEIGEVPLTLQTRLLRVLDRRTIKRVGSNAERAVDVRVIAATNRDLRDEVRSGRFRQDLYYRLAVVCVTLPPLRDRPEDIPLLARHFLWQAGCADPDRVLRPELVDALLSRRWPGNVRELRNVAERAVVLGEGSSGELVDLDPRLAPHDRDLVPSEAGDRELPPADLPAGQIGATRNGDGPEEVPDLAQLIRALQPLLERPYKEAKETLTDLLEQRYMARLLDRHGGNISRMAQEAGVDRGLVRLFLRKHGLKA